MADAPACPMVPVSWGELLDKITILELKAERIRDARAVSNVEKELEALRAAAGKGMMEGRVLPLVTELKAVNAQLWDIEDSVRLCEEDGEFGADFVALARKVYKTNDLRAALKRDLNRVLGSELVEEKSYAEPFRVSADV